jgi:hypothetical protein
MATKKLTDLTEISAVNMTQDDLFYLVDPNNPTQDPSGSSFKATLGNISTAVGNIYGGVANGLATLDGGAKLKAEQIPTVGLVNSFNGRDGTVLPVAGDYTALQVNYANTPAIITGTTVATLLDKLSQMTGGIGHTIINNRGGVQPTIAPLTKGAFTAVQYTTAGALTIDAISNNAVYPNPFTDSEIYDTTNNTFYDNGIVGQSHIWVFDFELEKGAVGDQVPVIVRFRNKTTPANYSRTQFFYFGASDATTFNNQVAFHTIATNETIQGGIGTGYELHIKCEKKDLDSVKLLSAIRISLMPRI